MVRNQQHGGFDRSGAGQQGLLLRGFDVPHQQCHGLRVRATCFAGYPQHAACRVGAGRVVGLGARGVQHLKSHAIPHPALPCHARRGGAQALQRMLGFDRPCQRRSWLLCQHGGRTPGVVGIAVAEHEHVYPFAQRPQQGHQHAVARITFEAEARACVVQQGARGRAHQHGIALANVGRQQLKLARRGPRRLPAQQGHQQRHRPQAQLPRQAHGQQAAAQQGQHPGPQRCCGQKHHRPGPTGQPLQPSRQGLQSPRRQRPQRRPHHPGQRQGRDHQRDPRYGQQVGRKPHQRHLAKQQQAQRRERQRHHPLLTQ